MDWIIMAQDMDQWRLSWSRYPVWGKSNCKKESSLSAKQVAVSLDQGLLIFFYAMDPFGSLVKPMVPVSE
jgi:hypothetical protein